MLDTIIPNVYRYHSITKTQMEEFNNQWLFYALDDMRYGQAFCKHFDLGNSTPLYNFRDTAMCKRWIKENYLLKNAN